MVDWSVENVTTNKITALIYTMATTKKYWKSIEELDNSPVVEQLKNNEFATNMDTESFLSNKSTLENTQTSRRDFLKYLGFSTAAATLAACEAPIVESIPYVIAPDKLVPGIASYFASTYDDGSNFASVLVKTREGRPIKYEPNTDAKVNGCTNAQVQGAVLNLYDATRVTQPMKDGAVITYDQLDNEVRAGIEKAVRAGKRVVLLTHTVNSPSSQNIINSLVEKWETFNHIQLDALSVSNQLNAWEKISGQRKFPVIHLDKASLIVSFASDFINDYNGLSVEGDYAKRRLPGKDMSRHIQLEANMSLTGSNADKRIKLKPSENQAALAYLYNKLAAKAGVASLKSAKTSIDASLDNVAEELWANRGTSIVLNGYNCGVSEYLAASINHILGNMGQTVSATHFIELRGGDDTAYEALLKDMKAGQVGAIIIAGANPGYNRNNGQEFTEALQKVETVVAITDKLHETASKAQYVVASHHSLESWGDGSPSTGAYTFMQPTISPLFETRQWQDCLLNWTRSDINYKDYVKNAWTSQGFDINDLLHDGFLAQSSGITINFSFDQLDEMASKVSSERKGLELVFYKKVGIGTGELSNNPWLQEFPDPISRASWDNYLTISASQAVELGLINKNLSNGALNGSRVNLKTPAGTLENVPVLIQPGQEYGTLGLAVGYGRKGVGKVGDDVGVNAFAVKSNGSWISGVEIELAEGEHEFACVQLHGTLMGRTIVKEVTLDEFINKPAQSEDRKGWNERTKFETHEGPVTSDKADLWTSFDHATGHFWNMSIDLNLCTGCGACVVACHAENNVPVVGKQEVRVSRDMHWLRIDRYYSSEETFAQDIETKNNINGLFGENGSLKGFGKLENPSENPEVVFQPVMCQHCNHAPCETVCPVAATVHSAEGMNHMAYNRCIGTRYCANNCPYKVRRFNWFLYNENPESFGVNYSMNEDLGKMVLNPDVTVRSRGVMEKCSFCIQRTQLGKLEAKKAGRKIIDGEVQTACMQACGTGAIQFGDYNDKESKVLALSNDKRAYHLLEDVGTKPSVFYQTKVRNKA